MIKVDIIEGEDILPTTIRQINKIWQKHWPNQPPLRIKDQKKFKHDIFFLILKTDQILGVGRLRPVKIKFKNSSYDIFGIADIVAVKKRQGFGKKIMRAMLNYIKKYNKTAIGFCSPKNSLFYKKCGFKITDKLKKRFVYNYRGHKKFSGGHVIYVTKESLIKDMLLSKENAKISIPPW